MTASAPLPSWSRWPPNCCETCEHWDADKLEQFSGRCRNPQSTNDGSKTDSRFRCQDFHRKAEEKK